MIWGWSVSFIISKYCRITTVTVTSPCRVIIIGKKSVQNTNRFTWDIFFSIRKRLLKKRRKKIRIYRFPRSNSPLSTWLNLAISLGFNGFQMLTICVGEVTNMIATYYKTTLRSIPACSGAIRPRPNSPSNFWLITYCTLDHTLCKCFTIITLTNLFCFWTCCL